MRDKKPRNAVGRCTELLGEGEKCISKSRASG